jgi:hypothetical protein
MEYAPYRQYSTPDYHCRKEYVLEAVVRQLDLPAYRLTKESNPTLDRCLTRKLTTPHQSSYPNLSIRIHCETRLMRCQGRRSRRAAMEATADTLDTNPPVLAITLDRGGTTALFRLPSGERPVNWLKDPPWCRAR